MKITTKGQVTIPLSIRQRFGLLPHTEVEFLVKGNNIILVPKELSFSRLKGIAKGKFSTAEIMKLIRE